MFLNDVIASPQYRSLGAGVRAVSADEYVVSPRMPVATTASGPVLTVEQPSPADRTYASIERAGILALNLY